MAIFYFNSGRKTKKKKSVTATVEKDMEEMVTQSVIQVWDDVPDDKIKNEIK